MSGMTDPQDGSLLPKPVLWRVQLPHSVWALQVMGLLPYDLQPMLQLQSAGLRAEYCMQDILHAARIRNASPDFNADTLRAVAQRVNPKRYDLCNQKLRLHRCSADQILDFVYGVDHVIDVGERVYAGVDLTLNAAALADKVNKAQQLTKMRAYIGIRQFIVVHMVGDWNNPDPAIVRKSTDAFWDALCDAFNGPADRVHVVRFHVS
jgi:hypothetical protein